MEKKATTYTASTVSHKPLPLLSTANPPQGSKTELPLVEAIDPKQESPPKGREFNLPKKPKLAIIGCSDTNKNAPFNKTNEFEFWGVNNLFTNMGDKPWTRWFEIHHIEKNPVHGMWERRGKIDFRGMPVDQYLRHLQSMNIPIYMRAPCELVPNAVLYPIKEILSAFGDYFTNTVSYMLALGLLEGHYEEIHVYGVDMAVDSEYFWQRPSCEYFLGIAAGRGVKIVMPDECDLLKTRFLYGFDDKMEHRWIKKVDNSIKSMTEKHAQTVQKEKVARMQKDQYVGAIAAANEMKKIWKNL